MLSWLPFLYLLRVPLLCWLVAIALAPLGAFAFSPARAMFEGLFDLRFRGATWVMLGTLLAATAVWLCSLLVLHYGRMRFPGARSWEPWEKWKSWVLFLICSVPVVVLVLLGALQVSESKLAVVGGAAVGVVVFGGLFLAGYKLYQKYSRGPLAQWIAQWFIFSEEGYLDPARKPTMILLRGHMLAIFLMVMFSVIYVAAGLSKYALLAGSEQSWSAWLPNPPALAYVFMLLAVVCYGLAALSFFFDRFRVPVILPTLLLLFAAAQWPDADYFFEVQNVPRPPRLTPDVILGATKTGRPIIVCASGGGIQAGVWAARVLHGLADEYSDDFLKSVRLVSAASGGSMGTMHFVQEYKNGTIPQDRRRIVFESAARNSLDAVGWGLVGPDFVRLVAPYLVPRTLTRSWAVARVWDRDGNYAKPLSALRADVAQGDRPAVIFNVTVVESGEGVALTTFDFAPATEGRAQPPKTFYDYYGNADTVSDPTISGAVALSAAFPYVSPAARSNASLAAPDRYHFVDGGYYDNYGVASAMSFLDQAYDKDANGPVNLKCPAVLVVEIRASRGGTRDGGSPGFLFQGVAPGIALLNMRESAQRVRNDIAIQVLAEALDKRGVRMARVVFEPRERQVPLSWHLTGPQVKEIDNDWEELQKARQDCKNPIRIVGQFLGKIEACKP